VRKTLFASIAALVLAAVLASSARSAAPSPRPGFPRAGDDSAAGRTVVLGRPTDRSMAANVLSDQSVEAYVEYGQASGTYGQSTAAQILPAGQPAEIVLSGLQPDARYYYRLRYRSPGGGVYAADPESAFRTQRSPGSSFVFGIQADSHPERTKTMFDAALYAITLASAAADQPDFYISLGDDFSVDTLKSVTADTVAQLYLDQRAWLAPLGRSAPLFLVNGNHEQGAAYLLDGTPNNVAVYAQTARNRVFSQPAPDGFYTGDASNVPYIGLLRDYYAWTWGDALFAVIDPYWHSPIAVDNDYAGGDKTRDLWQATLGAEQYQWLKSTLENSPARYKFVFAHHVNGTGRGGVEGAGLYEWGGRSPSGSYDFDAKRPGWGLPIHQLMARNKVTIFFQGHDHLFVRQSLDGIVYQECPIPADYTYTDFNEDAYISGVRFPNAGHLRVTVAPDGVRVEYVRAFLPGDESSSQKNGAVAYSYSTDGKIKGGGIRR
jgi:hypothetical protein